VTTEELLPRDLEGGYRLLGKLGEGGMGVVYRGTALALDRPVAVKMLRPELADEQHPLTERFLNEARLAAQIESAHVVDVLHFGETAAGELFLVMEYLRGRTLESVLHAEGRVSPERVVHVGVQLCRALGAAHDLGVVHRDLKPANVMLVQRDGVNDFVKVLDFGIAKLVREQSAALTGDGMVVGTFHSIAPEQVTGKDLDGRADMYAFGALLYRMLTGEHVFDADDAPTFAYHHVHTPPIAPTQRFADLHVPPALEVVVMRCLEKDRDARYRDMREVSDALLDVFDDTNKGMGTQAIARHLGLRLPSDEASVPPGTLTTAPVAHEAEPERMRTDVLGTPVQEEPSLEGGPTEETAVDPTAETPMPTGVMPSPPPPVTFVPVSGSGNASLIVVGVLIALLVAIGGVVWIVLTHEEPGAADVAGAEESAEPTTAAAPTAPAAVVADDPPAATDDDKTPAATTAGKAPAASAKPAAPAAKPAAAKPTRRAVKKKPPPAEKYEGRALPPSKRKEKKRSKRRKKTEWDAVGAPPPLP
jgi:serine/threonine-protein kinase